MPHRAGSTDAPAGQGPPTPAGTPRCRAERGSTMFPHARRTRLLAVAAIACTLDPGLASFDLAVEGFAALCEQAGAHGVAVTLEFLPWTGIPDLAAAWRIVEGAGHPAGAIQL